MNVSFSWLNTSDGALVHITEFREHQIRSINMNTTEKLPEGNGRNTPELALSNAKMLLDLAMSNDRERLEAMGYKEVISNPPAILIMLRSSNDHFPCCPFSDYVLRF